jgi:ANTAR domain
VTRTNHATGKDHVRELESKVRDLSAQLRSQVVIAQAAGILVGRYPWLTGDLAMAALREVSQRHNIRTRVLARAVIGAPPPDPSAVTWLPRRVRRDPPALRFLADTDQPNRTSVVNAVLTTALSITDSDTGNVQVVDSTNGDLRIETHRGHPGEFLDFFDRVGHTGSACALASQSATRVTIADVATDTAYTPASRSVMLAAGYRACHSVPLRGPARLEGMVSTHFRRTGPVLTPAQCRALDDLGEQAGAWLDWHQATVVADALDDLHARASRRPA